MGKKRPVDPTRVTNATLHPFYWDIIEHKEVICYVIPTGVCYVKFMPFDNELYVLIHEDKAQIKMVAQELNKLKSIELHYVPLREYFAQGRPGFIYNNVFMEDIRMITDYRVPNGMLMNAFAATEVGNEKSRAKYRGFISTVVEGVQKADVDVINPPF